VLDLAPLRDALFLEPGVERIDIREDRQQLPQAPPRILHVLLDLTLFPTRGRVKELWLEQVMAGHRCKASVDLPNLTGTHPVDCVLYVVKDPALRNAAQHPERLGHRVEQHLVGRE